MSTRKDFMAYIMEQLSSLDDVRYRSMMGEYIIYYQDKIAAYVCDDRLLVKPVKAALHLLPNAPLEPPYSGAKEMLLIEDVDNKEFLCTLFEAMVDELPAVKRKKAKK